MTWTGPNVPAHTGTRILWAGLRLLLWFVLFYALEDDASRLYQRLPIRVDGPWILLGTSVTLLAALLAGFVVLRVLDHRPAGTLGFPLDRSAAPALGSGFVIGAAALLLVIGLQVLIGWINFQPDRGSLHEWSLTLLRDLGLFGVAAAAEEAIFRGYPFQALARAAGAPAAVLLGSSAFALAHTQNPNADVVALINIFLAGVLLSIAFLLTGSLWFATAIHLGWNWSMASLVDLPVSGLEWFDTPLYEPVVSGPAWFTGGAFGPEGGWSGTIAFALATGVVCWYSKTRKMVAAA